MNETCDDVSVLLPVHSGAAVGHLEAAVLSILEQDCPPAEFVVVEDGPLDRRHLDVLSYLERSHPRVIRVRLPVNSGPGVANQAGLEVATGAWIAKADADDLSMPQRLRVQMRQLRETGADVCGSAMLEFDGEPGAPTTLRPALVDHKAIVRRMRTNSPISHPTAMFRRELAVACGGYPDMRFAEDYVLFARLISHNARFTGISEPLVHFRADAGMHTRRALGRQIGLEWKLQVELMACGVVGPVRRWWNLIIRLVYRSLPTSARVLVHRRVLGRPPTRTVEHFS